MALRLPTLEATRIRLVLRFRDHAAAAEVYDLCGPRVALTFEDGTSLSTSVAAAGGSSLVVEARPEPGSRVPQVGERLVVSWTELNDLASVQGEVEESDSADHAIVCSWPPAREQRRAFRRFPLELPVWMVRTAEGGEVVEGVTRDLSGGGVSVHLGQIPFRTGEHLVLMLRTEEHDLVLPAAVHWIRAEQAMLGFSFTRISQPDQDHLVRLVSLAEAARGR